MGTGRLNIDLGAVVANWRALDAMTAPDCETGAVVKADSYGLDATRVAPALYEAGARTFFVAMAEEGAAIRTVAGPDARIMVFSGHMAGDAEVIAAQGLIPMLSSVDQVQRHFEALPDHPFGIQLDSGMNRLGLEPADWADLRGEVLAKGPALIMSHLACADDAADPMNRQQLDCFREMTEGVDAPLSLGATGGILLGEEYHFDMTRPGIGLYGGFPYEDARPVVRLSLPVIQTRTVAPGEAVGYGCSWRATRESRIATVSCGYADGLIRAMSSRAMLYHEGTACPQVGRVSMDTITVDVTDLGGEPEALDILCPKQGIDILADAAGTIGYEILTSLGARYNRVYI
ncbi:alanine racemase [Palleronia caenipelagi]|uniref:Alanine racemase n=1 Tax=Palleronia caenipelagi TaxID=2489174 RepID=A0A547Q304_9RHOB|nr:alanine racemase [Palleronia caenipelagi]TRD20767.1 alanine racemase [Palleronia caenipelagi]